MIKFGIGQAVRRVEDQRFLTGQGRYVDDIALPGMCHGVNVLSPHAHARIKKVDASKAGAAPGVLLVLTGADIAHDHLGAFTAAMMPEDLGAPKGHRIHQQLLQSDKSRFVGDRIAFVVAETLAQARDAAEMVEVDYEPLPAVALLEDAAKDGAPKVWDDNPNGNVAFQLMIGDQAATDTAFARAKHHVKLRIENNRLTPVSMEPRTAIGDYNTAEDSYTLYTSSQNPHGARTEIAQILHIAENQLRVVSPDVGGGFGLKGGAFPDDALVLWASKKLRRPVKWVATRSEAMMTDHTGRDLVSYGELALDEKGKILAIRSQSLFQVGAYFVGPGMVSGLFSMRFIPEAYDVQAIHVMCKGLFTNTPQAGPYRGAGRPEAAYFTERMIEHAAKQIGMDVAEIRRVNLISSDKFPYNTPTWYCYDSGEFVRLLDKCIDMADWKGYAKRKTASEKAGKLRGRSVCYYIEFGGIFNDRMDIRFDPVGPSRCSAARIRTVRGTRRCSHNSSMNSSVAETMTRKVVTCADTISVVEIMERMTQGKFRHVPIAQRGRLAGIVSIGELVKERLEELENKLLNVGSVTASIAHEVRQPLAAIATNSSAALRFLERTPPDYDEIRAALSRIIGDCHRTSEVFESIRALFRTVDHGNQPIEMNEIMLGVLKSFDEELKGHGVTIRLQLMPELPLVEGHRGQLEQVIYNLIHNAIDAMDTTTDRSRTLWVRTELHGRDAIRVAVEELGTRN